MMFFKIVLSCGINAVVLSLLKTCLLDVFDKSLVLRKIDGVKNTVFLCTFDAIPIDVVIKKLCGWNSNIDFFTDIIYSGRQFADVITNFYNTSTFNADGIFCSRNFDVVKNVPDFFFGFRNGIFSGISGKLTYFE